MTLIYMQQDYEAINYEAINYLRDKISLDPGFKVFSSEDDLDLIERDTLFFPNYNGSNSYLVLFSRSDNYYSAIIDKKSFSRKHTSPQNSVISIRSPLLGYLGTIVEGVFIKDCNTFIGEIPMFICGLCLFHYPIRDKLRRFNDFVSRLVPDKKISNLKIKSTIFLGIDKLEDCLTTEFISFPNSNYIRGVNFHTPGRRKLIVLGLGYKKERPMKDKGVANLEIRRGPTRDTYDLYCLIGLGELSRVGYALVPSSEVKDLCIKALKGKKKAVVACVYDKHKDKWRPFKTSTSKEPDYVEYMEK